MSEDLSSNEIRTITNAKFEVLNKRNTATSRMTPNVRLHTKRRDDTLFANYTCCKATPAGIGAQLEDIVIDAEGLGFDCDADQMGRNVRYMESVLRLPVDCFI